MLADSAGSDWVRNLAKIPVATIKIGGETFTGRNRQVSPAMSEAARRAIREKYQPEYSGDLSSWTATATLVAVELVAPS